MPQVLGGTRGLPSEREADGLQLSVLLVLLQLHDALLCGAHICCHSRPRAGPHLARTLLQHTMRQPSASSRLFPFYCGSHGAACLARILCSEESSLGFFAAHRVRLLQTQSRSIRPLLGVLVCLSIFPTGAGVDTEERRAGGAYEGVVDQQGAAQ
jgi:hypothetical protein